MFLSIILLNALLTQAVAMESPPPMGGPPPSLPQEVRLSREELATLRKKNSPSLPSIKRMWFTRDCSEGFARTAVPCDTYRLWIDVKGASPKKHSRVRMYHWYSVPQYYGTFGELGISLHKNKRVFSIAFSGITSFGSEELIEVWEGDKHFFQEIQFAFRKGKPPVINYLKFPR